MIVPAGWVSVLLLAVWPGTPVPFNFLVLRPDVLLHVARVCTSEIAVSVWTG